jgi:hypothetical protein
VQARMPHIFLSGTSLGVYNLVVNNFAKGDAMFKKIIAKKILKKISICAAKREGLIIIGSLVMIAGQAALQKVSEKKN